MRPSACLALLLLAAPCALASSGDKLPGYQHCLSHCTVTACSRARPPQPLALRLTRWSCEDDCRYTCTHALTDAHVKDPGARIHQYYGKWPFWRFLGAQEPASVLFSFFNLAAHVYGLRRVRREVSKGHPMRPFLLLFAYVGINAWVWSAIFHTRDKPFTEKMDYFSAGASIMYGFFMACVRVFGLYPPASRTRLTSGYVQHRTASERLRPLTLLTIVCGTFYALHVLYLSTAPRFDYGYNMRASVAVGMLHNVVWLLYSASPPFPTVRLFPARSCEYRPPYASKPLIAVSSTMLAMSLELLDFPPWRRVLDAHALWHLATAPVVVYWYGFLVQDAKDEAWGSERDRLAP
ncbi:Per1-like protein [Auricularia subglabra TFB-10046 SS5]|nr:Per1-like protein [Auricularia subglabra TFB-10046 SS5]